MCADFSRALGLANVVSFRHSRRIVEKLICDHRDRAWSHTLLLASATDRGDFDSLSSFIADFSMARAALVDRLTLSPLRFVGAVRMRRRRRDQAAMLMRRHVRMLVDHLHRPLTAKAARRALVEYGRQAHPLLEEMLAGDEIEGALGEEILSVMAETPSTSLALAIYRHWTTARDEQARAAIRLLASLRLAGVSYHVPQTQFLDALQREALHARSLAECVRDLGTEGSDVVLHEALSTRLAEALRAMAEIVTILHPHSATTASAEVAVPDAEVRRLERLVDSMGRSLPQSLRRQVLPVLVSSTALGNGAGAAPTDERGSRTARLEALARADDPWLQACAVHRIVELRIAQSASLVESLASSDSDVVRDAALHARGRLLHPDDEEERLPMLSIIEKVLYLKNVELFQTIPAEDLAEVARVAEELRFEPGEELIREGAPGDELYIIIEGSVVVSAGGRRLARLEEKSVIGEMAILSDAPTSARCVAATKGRALRIRRPNFRRFLLDYPEIAIGLINLLSVRLRETSAQVPSGNQEG
jgi:hypothetical protein